MHPDEALDRLLAGNARFVEGRLDERPLTSRRAEVASGQDPFAVVLTCSDSRVPAEHVFDQGLGDLFVCRVAGNVLDPVVIGSIEFALSQFSPALIVVMGHERCGAVTAALELARSGGRAPGSIHAVVDAIARVAGQAMSVEEAVRANTLAVAGSLTGRSEIVREAVYSDALRVVPAQYSLDSGRVALL